MSTINPRSKRAFFLIADGLGDRPIAEMDGKTPLEYAETPALDHLVKEGMAGLIHPYKAGTRCGTDWGHFSLFGLDPKNFYTGRGPIEAYSAGLKLKTGDIAFRGNFATVDEALRVIDRRAGRISDAGDIRELLAAVEGLEKNGCSLQLKALTEHRLAVVLRGEGLGGRVADVDPGTAREGEKVRDPRPLARTPEDQKAADALAALLDEVHKIWQAHPVNKRRREAGKLPANYILTRGSGKAMMPPPFTERYPGAKVAVIAGDDTITGIGEMCGFKGFRRESFTGSFDTDYRGKAELAQKLSRDYDLVIVHIKGTDLAGHDNLPFKKAEIVEHIDKIFRYWREENKGKDYYYALAADHSTPCVRRDHSADPVPAFISGRDVRKDAVVSFGERMCRAGLLNNYTGPAFMGTIMDYLELCPKLGA